MRDHVGRVSGGLVGGISRRVERQYLMRSFLSEGIPVDIDSVKQRMRVPHPAIQKQHRSISTSTYRYKAHPIIITPQSISFPCSAALRWCFSNTSLTIFDLGATSRRNSNPSSSEPRRIAEAVPNMRANRAVSIVDGCVSNVSKRRNQDWLVR